MDSYVCLNLNISYQTVTYRIFITIHNIVVLCSLKMYFCLIGYIVQEGKIFLSSSCLRHCINVDISKSLRAQGDLTVRLTRFNIPNYTLISPSSSTIRPREGNV